MTDQPGFIPSEDRGARLLEQIREQLYISNLIAVAQYIAADVPARRRAEFAATIEERLRRNQ